MNRFWDAWREEKSVRTAIRFDWDLQPAASGSLWRERPLDAKIAADNERNRGRRKLDCYCRIAQTWKRLQLLADYYGQLFLPEIQWENKFSLYYCRPWTQTEENFCYAWFCRYKLLILCLGLSPTIVVRRWYCVRFRPIALVFFRYYISYRRSPIA